ncbi:hypothetical protein SEVIR_4G281401v4 [Setaria viridis]|uniref:Uncharacterized protein n=1 Tax=Setaria viridis TaxID=4556 RepID=A0A4U6V2G3_SETVI|nr:hypothetical protein SEVIR_4G281401v2 [Setaria viridis]
MLWLNPAYPGSDLAIDRVGGCPSWCVPESVAGDVAAGCRPTILFPATTELTLKCRRPRAVDRSPPGAASIWPPWWVACLPLEVGAGDGWRCCRTSSTVVGLCARGWFYLEPSAGNAAGGRRPSGGGRPPRCRCALLLVRAAESSSIAR